jgi:hypothetical protein
MGCFRTIGCLVVAVIIAAVAFVTRDQWLPLLEHRRAAPTVATGTESWKLLTPDGAARAKEIIQRLESRSGPVFANVDGADLTAYIFQELSKELPPSAENAEAAVIGDKLWVRASVKPSDFGNPKDLGPLSSVLGEREPVQFGGTLDIVHPGLGEYRVTDLKIRDLKLPAAMIPRLLRRYEKGSRPAGVADDALPLVVPAHIGDVRIKNGKITLYKAVR